ncbi:OmpA family protein [Variovorax paradoxus]|nr:OmpA family protein [Variovorax paradoxus]
MNKQIKAAGIALAVAALLSLAGCGTSTVSKNISDDGRAGEVVFPDIGKDAWLKEGTFPNLDNLRRIAPGVSKDQLYDLVGRPHFRESLFGVREWDYIFNFRVPGGVKTCQYKVIYDTALRAQSFHWLPADCAELLKVTSPPVERIAEKVAVPQRVELSADALFAFGRSGQADLLPQGRRELDTLAAGLRSGRETSRLRITGHTDRLGSTSFNEQLSLARATTVRDHLVQAGVPARGMQVQGKGETEPKVQCEQKKREELIACLAPNRRVEIEVYEER